jgi:hypothetical protein
VVVQEMAVCQVLLVVEKVDQTALVEQEIHLLLVHLKEMMVEQVQEDLKLKLLAEVELVQQVKRTTQEILQEGLEVQVLILLFIIIHQLVNQDQFLAHDILLVAVEVQAKLQLTQEVLVV